MQGSSLLIALLRPLRSSVACDGLGLLLLSGICNPCGAWPSVTFLFPMVLHRWGELG